MKKKATIPNYKYSNRIQIGEHDIELPNCPKDLKEVLFINEDEENAFWDRKKVIKLFPQVWLEFIPGYTKINQDTTLRDKDGLLSHLSKDDTLLVIKTYEE